MTIKNSNLERRFNKSGYFVKDVLAMIRELCLRFGISLEDRNAIVIVIILANEQDLFRISFTIYFKSVLEHSDD